MAKTFPNLEKVPTKHGARFGFSSADAFPGSLWVPTLIAVHEAQTMGEQHESLQAATLYISASRARLLTRAHNKAVYRTRGNGLQARFRMGSDDPRMNYLAVGLAKIGYQTPDARTPNPAFAVVDDTFEGYRRVVGDPSEELHEPEARIGLNAIHILAADLHDHHPGFEIHEKLEAAGISPQ